MDEEKGSSDSEDEHFGTGPTVSTGVTDEMASVGLTSSTPSNTGPSGSGIKLKRKRGEGSSTGVTDEMASVGLTSSTPSNTGPSGSGIKLKRKRGEGSSKSKKQKVLATKQVAYAVSVIANVSMDRAAALTTNQETSMSEVMNLYFLLTM